jgi:hypothetical protein
MGLNSVVKMDFTTYSSRYHSRTVFATRNNNGDRGLNGYTAGSADSFANNLSFSLEAQLAPRDLESPTGNMTDVYRLFSP